MSTRTPAWAVTPEKVAEAVRRIIEVARPVKVLLFGSYVRGRAGPNSDLDVLVVVEDAVENPRKESVRIRHALRDILMPLDILVVPRSRWEQFKEQPGLIFREAFETGRVVHESAEAA